MTREKIHVHSSVSLTPAQSPAHVAEIAPLLRRRMSPLTKMAVAAGLDCCRKAGISPSEPRVVLASRHGEMGVTVDLLRQMADGETLSPMGFSNSVHHAALGYWSLATGNRKAARAVAGGEASFCYGFLDAWGLLNESDPSPVLLLAADDAVPAPFDVESAPYAAAFLLTRAGPHEKGAFEFELAGTSSKGPAHKKAPAVPALDFLRWISSEEPFLEFSLGRNIWRWKK